jgi:hypothetical protein
VSSNIMAGTFYIVFINIMAGTFYIIIWDSGDVRFVLDQQFL